MACPLDKGGKGDYINKRDIIINNMDCDYLPYNKKLKERSRELRNNMTAAEKKLWYEYLRNYKYIFLRQKPIDNYIVDFFCSKLKLVIEIDGETHITEEDKKYDKRRTMILEKYGLKVLRFWNYDVLNGVEIVGEMIEREIGKIEKSFLRKNPPNPLYQGGDNPPNSL